MPTDDLYGSDSCPDDSLAKPSDDFGRGAVEPIVRGGLGGLGQKTNATQARELAGRYKVYALAQELRDTEARKLSAKYGLEYDRIRAILDRTGALPVSRDPAEQLEFIRKHGLIHRPDLVDILESLPKEEALQLLEGDELLNIEKRIITIECLNSGFFPFCTLDELQGLTEQFIAYLQDNREVLLDTGHPRTTFGPSPFFERNLSRLYYLQLAEQADLVRGISQTDAKLVEGMRDKLFSLKLEILRILGRALQKRTKTVSKKCIKAAANAMTPAEIQFCRHIDLLYNNAILEAARSTAGTMPPRPGGLSDLVHVIGHFDQELNVGIDWRVRESLGHLIETDSAGKSYMPVRRYVQALGTPDRQAIEEALDLPYRLQDDVVAHQHKYLQSVEKALNRTLVKQVEMHDALRGLGEYPGESNVFRKRGRHWVVVYQGRPALVPHTKGMYHIAALISKPGVELSATELDRELPERKRNLATSWIEHTTLADAKEAGLEPHRPEAAGYAFDSKTEKELQERRELLVREAQAARDAGDPQETVEKEEELSQIDEYLAKSTNVRGRARKQADSTEQTRKRVYHHFETALNNIGDADTELAWHLRRALRRGHECQYIPEEPTEWVTS